MTTTHRTILTFAMVFAFLAMPLLATAQRPDSPHPSRMIGDQFHANVMRPGQLKQIITKDIARGVRQLSIRGTLNSDDIHTLESILKRSSCVNDRGRNIDNYVDLDLSDAEFAQSISSRRDEIKYDLFDYATHLRSIRLPRHTRVIGNRAFYHCQQLEVVEMPRYVVSIGDEAFRACTRLTDIRFPEGLEEIGKRCFYECEQLRYVQLPNTLLTIGDEAFAYCPLTTLHLPSSLQTLGYRSLEGTQLREIDIPRDAHIEGGMPGNNNNLERIVVERGNREYVSEHGVLYDYQGTVLLLTPAAYRGHLSMPDGLEEIAPYACQGSGITSVDMPASLRKIGKSAFQNCTGLSMVSIPYNVSVIEPLTFSGCTNLQRVDLSGNVRILGEKAFEGCKNLSDFIIPISVTELGKEVFMECKGLREIRIPESITTLPFGCFRNCEGLLEVHLPARLTKIGEEAFRGCLNLPAITLPPYLTTIDNEAFRSCERLQEIVIPRSVTHIGKKPFTKCHQLTRIICESATPPELKSTDNKDVLLIVPAGSASLYKKASGWKKHKNIQEMTR